MRQKTETREPETEIRKPKTENPDSRLWSSCVAAADCRRGARGRGSPERRGPKPETRNPKPGIRNPKNETQKHETRNTKPEAPNTKHETRAPKHETRNTNPETGNLKHEARSPESRKARPNFETQNPGAVQGRDCSETIKTGYSSRVCIRTVKFETIFATKYVAAADLIKTSICDTYLG